MDINAALQELRDLLREQSTTDAEQALQVVATEYGNDVPELRRRWRERYGCSPAEFMEREQASQENLEALKQASTLRAITKATTLAIDKWKVHGLYKELAGALFVLPDGKQYAFVAYVEDDPAFAVRAVDTSTLRVANLSVDHLDEIAAQIRPGLVFRR